MQIKDTILATLIDGLSGELSSNNPKIRAALQPKVEKVVRNYLNGLEQRQQLDLNRPGETLKSLFTLGLTKGLQIGSNQKFLATIITDELLNSPKLCTDMAEVIQNAIDELIPMEATVQLLSQAEIEELKMKVGKQKYWLEVGKIFLLVCGVMLLLLSLFSSGASAAPFWIATVAFLVLGVSTPFLSILVETGAIEFAFFGNDFNFESGIYYHKARSVIDITRSLTETGRTNEIVLGVLVGLFSLVAPAIKTLVLPMLPPSNFKTEAQRFLWRFAWVDVMAVGIVVSFLATDQIIGHEANNSLLFTGNSQLEDGIFFFLFYLMFAGFSNRVSRKTEEVKPVENVYY